MNLQHVPYREIDKKKWDRCVQQSSAPLIYARSFYLDQMSACWDALVWGDYEAVMPLTWDRKYGITYLYQPFLTLQLGIFGKKINAPKQEAFLQQVRERFRFTEINLNGSNHFPTTGFRLKMKTDYSLSLHPSFDKLEAGFNSNLRRNVKKAVNAGCRYTTGISPKQVLQLAKKQLQGYTKLRRDALQRFAKLTTQLLEEKKAVTAGVVLDDRLLASAIFFLSDNRAYYILAGNDPAGKRAGASHLLLHEFIRAYAGSTYTLDFTGSDIASIALFYESFGATASQYPSLRINRLPAPLKWVKK